MNPKSPNDTSNSDKHKHVRDHSHHNSSKPCTHVDNHLPNYVDNHLSNHVDNHLPNDVDNHPPNHVPQPVPKEERKGGEKVLESKDKEIEEVNERLRNMERKCSEETTKREDAQTNVEKLIEELSLLKRIQELEITFNLSQEKNKVLTIKLSETEEKLQKLQVNMEALSTELSESQQRRGNEKNKRIDKLSTKLNSAQAQLEQKEQESLDHADLLKKEQGNVTTLQKEVESKESENCELTKQIKELNEKIEKEQKEIHDFKTKCETHDGEYKKLKDSMVESEEIVALL